MPVNPNLKGPATPVSCTKAEVSRFVVTSQPQTIISDNSSSAHRLGFMLFNDDNSKLYCSFGATASTTVYSLEVGSNQLFIFTPPFSMNCYVSAVRANGSGPVTITEFF